MTEDLFVEKTFSMTPCALIYHECVTVELLCGSRELSKVWNNDLCTETEFFHHNLYILEKWMRSAAAAHRWGTCEWTQQKP